MSLTNSTFGLRKLLQEDQNEQEKLVLCQIPKQKKTFSDNSAHKD